jgi:hypothetical protein
MAEQLSLPFSPIYSIWSDGYHYVMAETLEDALDEAGYDPDEELNQDGWGVLSPNMWFSFTYEDVTQGHTEEICALLVERVIQDPEGELTVEFPVWRWLEILPPPATSPTREADRQKNPSIGYARFWR